MQNTLHCILFDQVNNMKLYWRIKLGGSWTWRPAVVVDEDPYWTSVLRYGVEEGEEE